MHICTLRLESKPPYRIVINLSVVSVNAHPLGQIEHPEKPFLHVMPDYDLSSLPLMIDLLTILVASSSRGTPHN